MNHAIFISVGSLVASLLAAAVGLRIARAVGWKEQGSFALVGFTAALYAALNLPSTLAPIADEVVIWATRFQLAAAALHALAWLRFAVLTLGGGRYRFDCPLQWALWLSAAGFVVPGVAFTGRVWVHGVSSLDVHYVLAELTPAGHLLVALVVAVFGLLALRHRRAWRAGRRDAGPLAVAFALYFLLAVNDAAAAAGLLATPFLIEVGFFIPLGVVAWTNGSRFLADARELAALRVRLEELVELRTRELHGAHEQLRRSEKLAMLGQVAAGVAHEVNNPAAVVAGNLDYLQAALRQGELPRDAMDCITESSKAVRRIAGIVRQLLQAGRAAGRPASHTLVQVAPIVRAAAKASQSAAAHVRVEEDVAEWLHAVGEEDLLHQVLVNLLTNAAQAIPEDRRDGRVVITARLLEDRVRIVVSDNGAGMTDEVMRKAFEPFFTTKGPGQGSGLGLAISKGLMTSLGGDLRLESVPGQGTRAVLDLPGEVALSGGPPRARRAPAARRPSEAIPFS